MTAGDLANYEVTNASGGFDPPITTTGVTMAGNVATVTVSRPSEGYDRFSVKGGVIADTATTPNFADAVSKIQPRDPGVNAQLGGTDSNGFVRGGFYKVEWVFDLPAGATAPLECAFTVAITDGGVEANETATAPRDNGRRSCTVSYPFTGSETLIRAVSLTYGGVQMQTGDFQPDSRF